MLISLIGHGSAICAVIVGAVLVGLQIYDNIRAANDDT